MSRSDKRFQTTSIRRAAKGRLHRHTSSSERARQVYGLSNYALSKSREELKDAWSAASAELREQRDHIYRKNIRS
ncbi:MAG: hypothetical protein OIF57_06950 [Marinobacterium sp.]|nr:hypothetical protein [Marinobacterium sp.]